MKTAFNNFFGANGNPNSIELIAISLAIAMLVIAILLYMVFRDRS